MLGLSFKVDIADLVLEARKMVAGKPLAEALFNLAFIATPPEVTELKKQAEVTIQVVPGGLVVVYLHARIQAVPRRRNASINLITEPGEPLVDLKCTGQSGTNSGRWMRENDVWFGSVFQQFRPYLFKCRIDRRIEECRNE
jgi:hypothetical protein